MRTESVAGVRLLYRTERGARNGGKVCREVPVCAVRQVPSVFVSCKIEPLKAKLEINERISASQMQAEQPMRKLMSIISRTLLVTLLCLSQVAVQAEDATFSEAELDQMLAPIALYCR